jgi:hypothetical protein
MQGTGGEASQNGHGSPIRKDMQHTHDSDVTGALPILTPKTSEERGYAGSHDFESLIRSLRAQFALDRQVASQPDATRCGICYLHYLVSELTYREEGYYICSRCEQALGNQRITMLRKQQKL